MKTVREIIKADLNEKMIIKIKQEKYSKESNKNMNKQDKMKIFRASKDRAAIFRRKFELKLWQNDKIEEI